MKLLYNIDRLWSELLIQIPVGLLVDRSKFFFKSNSLKFPSKLRWTKTSHGFKSSHDHMRKAWFDFVARKITSWYESDPRRKPGAQKFNGAQRVLGDSISVLESGSRKLLVKSTQIIGGVSQSWIEIFEVRSIVRFPFESSYKYI